MNEPLRIAVPIHSFEPGGVERVALNLGTAWHEAGEAVTVVLGRKDGAMAGIAPDLRYACTREPVPTALVETPWMIYALWRYLRRNRVDVLFASGNTYAVVAAAMKLLLGRRCPPIALKISNDLARTHLPAPARWFYRRWLRMQGRKIDHFIGMAEPMRGEMREAIGIADSRISIIEDPALEKGQMRGLLAIPRDAAAVREPNFVAIGRLAPQKNFAMLLQAFARLRDPAARLVIVGEGPERAKLERLVRELGLEKRVTLPGHGDPAPYLIKAEALVMSSDYEGVPAVVIEALAAGIPVVTTDCSVSMAELTGNGAFGLLVPPRAADRLAAAMTSVLAMPFDPARARASVQRFRIAVAAGRYRALFATLAQSR